MRTHPKIVKNGRYEMDIDVDEFMAILGLIIAKISRSIPS